MVKIETKAYGSLEIESEDLITFQEGLFAFEQYKKYALVKKDETSIFMWLQCLDEKDLAFLIVSPNELISGYKPVIANELLATIKLENIEAAEIFCICTVPASQPEKMTINLQGPLLVDRDEGLGGQFISADDRHLVKTPVFELIEKDESA